MFRVFFTACWRVSTGIGDGAASRLVRAIITSRDKLPDPLEKQLLRDTIVCQRGVNLFWPE